MPPSRPSVKLVAIPRAPGTRMYYSIVPQESGPDMLMLLEERSSSAAFGYLELRVRAHGLRGDIDISTGDGRAILDEIDGRAHGRSGDDRIMVAGRFDQLDLSTGDGRIEAGARRGSKRLTAWSLKSGDGAVSLHLPQDLAALLDTRTRDGRLNIQLPIDVASRPKRNELVGELNGGGLSLRLRTGDGTITLGVSP